MAEAAVNFAIQNLGNLLVPEIKLLGGVKKEVESIKSELECLKSFLKDADARAAVEELEGGGSEEGVRTWVKQLREEAYRIEDVIDEYIFTVAKLPHHGSSLAAVLGGVFRLIKKLKLRHEVATEIEDIKSSLENIKRRRESYNFKPVDPGTSSGARSVIIPHESRVGSFFIEDDEVVGIESAREKLIHWLVKGKSNRSVISLLGEGGLGKTTLAGKIFNRKAVKDHFDCQAWITVGKEYEKKNLLRAIIKQFNHMAGHSALHDQIYNNMEEKELIGAVRDYLKDKTYMVVFDDVWKIDFWEDVEHALLDNRRGSRIMLTTRRKNVADFCRSSSFVQVHELETLPTNEAWKLFCRRAFGSSSDGCCPDDLEELSLEILAKCGGLPLAVVAVGGLLSTKNKVVSEWQKMLDGLSSKLGSDPYLKGCNKVLSEGYYDLPYHLKSCLLYFGLFPESHQINCARLIRLWIAESFVQYSKCPTSEQIAEEYLNELIDRSLIQVSSRDISGRARICRVHDLMYEIIVKKAKELGFCRFLNEEELSHHNKTRRISIHRNTEGVLKSIKDSKVRSIFVFSVDKLADPFMNIIVADFDLIKILDLEDAPIDYLPVGVGNLFHLHYLSVKNTKVKIIPKSIGKLLNLETLDLKRSLVSELPIQIKNLKKLRYLLVYTIDGSDFGYGKGAKIHEGFGCLTELQTLCYVQADPQVLTELGKLKQLRKLAIRLTDGNGIDVCALIANLQNLESFPIDASSIEQMFDIQSLASPPQSLQRLYIKGSMNKLPDWIFRLKNLIRIGLDLSGILTDDPLKDLHALPNLLELRLTDIGNYEYLHFKQGWFPKLQNLVLWNFKVVKSIVIEQGAMPNLRELDIGRCPLLMEIPGGIEHLRNLKLVYFEGMLRQVYWMTKDENWARVTEHIPDIRVIYMEAGKYFYWNTKFLSFLLPGDLEYLIEEFDRSNEQSNL